MNFTGNCADTQDLGLPDNWDRVSRWILFNGTVIIPTKPVIKPKAKKCPEIDTLADYSIDPPSTFWDKFPKNPLPMLPKTSIDVCKLQEKVDSVKSKMTSAQKLRACECIKSLIEGADSCQKSSLPPCFCQNAKSTYIYGEEVTDTIASWVKQKFVSGPFDQRSEERL